MKLLIAIYLLTALLGCSHGQSNNTCPVPVFVNSQYSTSYDCQLYFSPQSPSIGDKVVMKVNVSDIVTIIWTVTLHGKTEVIDQYNEDYVLRDKNKTLLWQSAAEGLSRFEATATNSCGGQATACFMLTACKSCSIQPPVPSYPHNHSKLVFENSNPTLATKIHADSSFFKFNWCFVGSDNYHVCCACGHGEYCSEQNWVLNETKDACSCKYSCSLTVNSVSMRYNNGSFYSEIFYGRNATLAITHVTVISKDNSHDHKSQALYYVIGSGAAVIIIIFLAIGVVCNIRERHCCSSKITYNIHHPVDQSSSPEFEVQERLLPISEPSTIDFDPPPTATNYGSTEQHRIVHI